jgi:SpoVK/Ycf46/Vps4 family AAA+-type ATPase
MALQAQPNPYWQQPSLSLASGAAGPQLASSIRVSNATHTTVRFGETTELSQETTFTKLPKSLQIWVKEGSLAAYALGAKTMLPEHLLLGIVRLAQEGFKKEYYKIKYESEPGVAEPYLATDEGRAQKHALLALFPDIPNNPQLKRTFYARTQYLELQLKRSLSDKAPEPSKIFGIIPRRGIGEEFGPSKILQTLRPVSRASGNVFESIFRFFSRLLNPTIELKLVWDKPVQEVLKRYVDSTSKPDGKIIQELSDNLREVPRNNLRLALDEDHAFKIDLNGDLEDTAATDTKARKYRELKDLLNAQASKGYMGPEQRQAIQELIERYAPDPDAPPGMTFRDLRNDDLASRLDFILNKLPWARRGLQVPGITIEDDAEASQAFKDGLRKSLNEQLYGMDAVKDKVIDLAYTNVFYRQRLNRPSTLPSANPAADQRTPGYRLLLVGPPGVGKSSIAKSIANALDRGYGEVHLGNISLRNDLTGHSQTYVEAQAGAIIKAIVDSKCANPVILLDEVDKLANNGGQQYGNPMETLQQLLTDEANKIFRDNYVGIPYDLSEVIFILTANDSSRLTDPLLDRLDKVSVHGYDIQEKVQIAGKHIIPKMYSRLNVQPKDQLKFEDETALTKLIETATFEAGVRDLERVLSAIVGNWLANRHIEGTYANSLYTGSKGNGVQSVTFEPAHVNGWLAALNIKPKGMYQVVKANTNSYVGRVNALTYNGDSLGGMFNYDAKLYKYRLPVQGFNFLPTIAYDDHTYHNLNGDMTKASLTNVLNWYKANALRLGLDYPEVTPQYADHWRLAVETSDATSIDGPSAGAALTLLLISAINGFPIKANFALTGQINLQGEVGLIGGVREKVMNAIANGATEIAIPKGNTYDLLDLPDWALAKLDKLVVAETIYDLFEHAYSQEPRNPKLMSFLDRMNSLETSGIIQRRGYIFKKHNITRENIKKYLEGSLVNVKVPQRYQTYVDQKKPFNDATIGPQAKPTLQNTLFTVAQPNIPISLREQLEKGQNPFAQPVILTLPNGQAGIPVVVREPVTIKRTGSAAQTTGQAQS